MISLSTFPIGMAKRGKIYKVMSENQPFQEEFYNKVFDLLFVKHQDKFIHCIDKGTWNRYDEDGGGCSKQPKTYFQWNIGNKTYKLFIIVVGLILKQAM